MICMTMPAATDVAPSLTRVRRWPGTSAPTAASTRIVPTKKGIACEM
jgi:hypothetical protein